MNLENWNLIAKHLTGNTSKEEDEKLANWRKENPENELLFKETENLWKASGRVNDTFTADTEAEWEKFTTRVASPAQSRKPVTLFNRRWLRIAALLVILAGTAWTLNMVLNTPGKVQGQANFDLATNTEVKFVDVTATDSMEVFFLPDSSKIYLNQNSTLSFAENFAGNTRVTKLTGEAFFEVQKSTKPFLVYAGGTEIRVVGTSFNINASEASGMVEVVVVEGQVSFKELDAPTSSGVMLSENDKIVYSKEKKSMERSKTTYDLWWKKINIDRNLEWEPIDWKGELKNLQDKTKQKLNRPSINGSGQKKE